MFSYAAWQSVKSEEQPYVISGLGTIQHAQNTFRVAAAKCLVKDNYTLPGKYKVETLIIYYGLEYYLRAPQHPAPISSSFLWAGIIRLALHMGYHRDPRHFKDVSPFEGEMRRRTWALLLELDALVSFLFGLPISIPRRFTDTELPRNLHDDDLSEDMAELPPPHPDTENSRVLYQRTTCQIMSVFADILDTAMDQAGSSYARILELDAALTKSDKKIPAILRPKQLAQALIDPIDVIVQRYLLQMRVCRARCVLHRRWLKAGRIDRRFAQSRWACIDAAVRILRIQFELDAETQPGGRLVKARWMLPRCIPDFLLGDMILCLELFYLKNGVGAEAELGDVISKEQILEILQMSRKIWRTSHRGSKDASRGYRLISRMLSISTGSSPASSSDGETGGTSAAKIPSYATPQMPGESVESLILGGGRHADVEISQDEFLRNSSAPRDAEGGISVVQEPPAFSQVHALPPGAATTNPLPDAESFAGTQQLHSIPDMSMNVEWVR